MDSSKDNTATASKSLKLWWYLLEMPDALFILSVVAGPMLALVMLAIGEDHGFRVVWTLVGGLLMIAVFVGFSILLGALLEGLVYLLQIVIRLVGTDRAAESIALWAPNALLIAGLVLIFLLGGHKIATGLNENRFVTADEHFQRCMQPVTREYQDSYELCRDGWDSPSIGSSGACSHHGGVETHWYTRRETYRPYSAEHCHRMALRRSWLD